MEPPEVSSIGFLYFKDMFNIDTSPEKLLSYGKNGSLYQNSDQLAWFVLCAHNSGVTYRTWGMTSPAQFIRLQILLPAKLRSKKSLCYSGMIIYNHQKLASWHLTFSQFTFFFFPESSCTCSLGGKIIIWFGEWEMIFLLWNYGLGKYFLIPECAFQVDL